MKFEILIITILTLGLAACQGQKSVIVEKAGGGSASGQSLPEGGVDSGGGNGVSGKPLESYQVDLRTVAEFQNGIVPVINNLKKTFPHLASDLTYLAKERSWYFIPVSLQKIPSFKLGTYFPTDQIAIQNKNEIWIDSTLYQKMDNDARTKLLMHELLMGVKILDFTSDFEKCMAAAAQAETAPHYDSNREICMKKYKLDDDWSNALGGAKNINITQDNYALIRKLTNELLESSDTVDGQELQDLLAAEKFRTYDNIFYNMTRP